MLFFMVHKAVTWSPKQPKYNNMCDGMLSMKWIYDIYSITHISARFT